jgi:hypothetical protein
MSPAVSTREGATVVKRGDPAKADAVHVFVRDTRELARFGPKAVAGALAGATVWIAYRALRSKPVAEVGRRGERR